MPASRPRSLLLRLDLRPNHPLLPLNQPLLLRRFKGLFWKAARIGGPLRRCRSALRLARLFKRSQGASAAWALLHLAAWRLHAPRPCIPICLPALLTPRPACCLPYPPAPCRPAGLLAQMRRCAPLQARG